MGIAACTLCPRACRADRRRASGFCGASDGLEVASVVLHRGEEPPLVGPEGKGVVNVFFAHCNLQCVYCQNADISGRTPRVPVRTLSVDHLADEVCRLLPESSGVLGLVTAAHFADRLPALIEAVHRRGLQPAVLYNSSGYESVATLRSLEGVVDIYMPDLKYMLPDVAARFSHAANYPAVATAAIAEMARQVGSSLKVADGTAYRGLLVRHLVLPGHVDNSLRCLDWLADNFNPFTLRLSLMAQYFPPRAGLPAPLDRTLSEEEYAAVCRHAEELGLTAGWIQEMSSQANYRPNFGSDNPFEPTPQS